jgi:hypothetical protein
MLRRFQPRQDRSQGCHLRRKRIAAFVDGAPEQAGEGGRLVIGKVGRHVGVIWCCHVPSSLRRIARPSRLSAD